jgi:sugar phosphate isomerase/epimerase
MRISVFPKGELEDIVRGALSVFDWIHLAQPLPIEGLELYSAMFVETTTSFTDGVSEALHAAGKEMPMLCVSPDFTNPDPKVRRVEVDREASLITAAHRISGSGVAVRVLSGQAHPGVSRGQGLDWAAEAIRSLLPLAAELDVTLALENHYKDGSWTYPEFAQTADVFLELLDRVGDDPHFGVQYDPSNAILAGQDSAEFLERVIDRVVTMQASDRSLQEGTSLDDLRLSNGALGYSPALSHGVIGQGLNDYPWIFRALSEAGYDGWISIEDGVNGMDEIRQSVEFLRAARGRYFGGSSALRVRSLERRRSEAGLPSLARSPLAGLQT